mgnify:CR=1 FL=1
MKIYEITSIKNEEQLDEMLPALLLPSIIAGARIAGPWLVKQGAKIVAQRGAAASVAGTAAKKGAEVVAKGNHSQKIEAKNLLAEIEQNEG